MHGVGSRNKFVRLAFRQVNEYQHEFDRKRSKSGRPTLGSIRAAGCSIA